MKPYSNDLRTKIVEAYQKGGRSIRQVAKRFSVSPSCVWLLLKRFRETGQVDPKPHGGGQKAKIEGKDVELLRQLVREHSDVTLMELGELFERATGIEVSRSTIALSLKKLGITRKKKTFHATQRDQDEDVRQARDQFIKNMPGMNTEKLVFVDETGVNLGMSRTYARAPEGERAQGDKPCHPENVSLIGAVKLHGVTAALMIEGAVDGEIFKGYIEQLLLPTLQPGDTVLTDNLPAHKVAGIEEAIESKGATLEYLPPYSPDLSPIEPCWSKAKEHLRKTAARTLNTLQSGVKKALEAVTESDVQGWFEHCGYCIESK